MSEQSEAHIKFLRGMRAVREHTPEPVSDDAVRDILEVGRWTGTASNRQPIEIVAVRDRAILQKIAENGVRAAAGAPVAFVIVTSGEADRKELEAFDNGRMSERLLLAARAHGLGGNVSTLKGEGPTIVKQALGIPADRAIWTVVTVGHIDREARKARTPNANPGRKPLNEFAHMDKY